MKAGKPFTPTRGQPLHAMRIVDSFAAGAVIAWPIILMVKSGFADALAILIIMTPVGIGVICAVTRRSPRQLAKHENTLRTAVLGVDPFWAHVALVADILLTTAFYGVEAFLLWGPVDSQVSDAVVFDSIALGLGIIGLFIYSHDKATYVIEPADEPVISKEHA